MHDSDRPGPDPQTIAGYIEATYPATATLEVGGSWFFSLDAERHFPNFATIVTDDDEYDRSSNLARPGVFRLNIGVGKETFDRLVGDQLAGGATPDYSAMDTVISHPVYAAQRFVAILNPSQATFDQVIRPLLDEAYARLERQHRLQHPDAG